MNGKIIVAAVIMLVLTVAFFALRTKEPREVIRFSEVSTRLATDHEEHDLRDDMLLWYFGADRTDTRPELGAETPDPFGLRRMRKIPGEAVTPEGEGFSGPSKSYYDSGQIREEAFFRDGVAEGPAKWYYESGALEQEAVFKGGVMEGFMRTYYEDGQIKQEVYYKGGLPEGTSRWYYENGTLMQEVEYSSGERDGVTRVYREDGALAGEWVYENGVVVDEKEIFRIDFN